MVNPIRRVVICGTSVFAMAIEAGLAALPGMEVVRLNPHLPAAVNRIAALDPDVVLVEQTDEYADLALALLNQGLPVVELDTQQGQVTVLSGRKFPISGAEDMVRLLEQIVVPTGDQ